jgi:hypothetical protein
MSKFYDIKNNGSFARYFIESVGKSDLPKNFELIKVDFSDLKNSLLSGISNELAKYKEYVQSIDSKTRCVFVIDHYEGVKSLELIPANSIVFCSNENCEKLTELSRNITVINIPLLNNVSKMVEFVPLETRDHLCSFVGTKNNEIRRNIYSTDNVFSIDARLKQYKYQEIIANSVFTLAPRGINVSSYRICEALRLGSVPVYISDKFILPEMFEKYGLSVKIEDYDNLTGILENIPSDKIQEMIDYGRVFYDSMFTFEGLKGWILKTLKTIK